MSEDKKLSDYNSNSQDEINENSRSYIEKGEIHNIDLQKYKSFKDIHIGSKAGNKVDESLFYEKNLFLCVKLPVQTILATDLLDSLPFL